MLSDITLIAFLIGCAGTFVTFFYWAGMAICKNPKSKKAAKVLGGFIGLAILSILIKPESTENQSYNSGYVEAEATSKAEVKVEKTEEPEEEEATAKPTVKPTEAPKKVKRENIVGTSNQSMKDIYMKPPTEVRNDVTGRWRICTSSQSKDYVNYAKSYYETRFTDEDEIHAIVDFGNNTTTKIATLSPEILTVTVHRYVNGEEKDAKALFSGKIMKEYLVYTDNGDIEEIK